MRTLTDYTHQLIALLPTGRVWPLANIVSRFKSLLEVFAGELQRVEASHSELVNELMPDTTGQLINQWEHVAGLPDPCAGPLATLQERVNALVAQLSIQGGLSEQFYIDLAARFGFTITITVLSPARWQVNAPLLTVTYFRAGISRAGDPVQTSGNALLQCVINKTKPAHTAVVYNFF